MNESMHIVLCADRRVLPGLHVAAYSLLERMSSLMERTCFSLFSEALTEADVALLRETLERTKKPFTLDLCRIATTAFDGFPSLNNSRTTYYRLLVPQMLNVERFLYVDVDTLCDVDVSELQMLDMKNFAVGWVPEAPLAHAADSSVSMQLGGSENEYYFNAGVMLVNVQEWRQQQITEQALDYLKNHIPAYWDQSALNFVLHRKAMKLDTKFNCISNMRKHWPALNRPYGEIGQLVHYLDYPKPWDFMGELIHPQYRTWRGVLNKTAMNDFRSWHNTPARNLPRTAKLRQGYKKVFKDRLLFAGYSRGWLKQVKGVGAS